MTKKTFEKTDKKGRKEEWSWEETPEAKKALAQYWARVKKDTLDTGF